ncbi:hypothetical protein DX933_08300 [Ornithinibacillus gellani]|uniref:hypothetical protein n=1 Tax=Ornithinibacillus gellani TaxID=2293253 RepID=UPI000F4AC08F|nr:hypothetical protein [Ornithinibacillus gellani]TQS74773.1 hypothetical protein DX933_08300 [Ornithinibacillus gellani]
MRKLFSLCAVIMLAFIIGACGDTGNDAGDSKDSADKEKDAQNEASENASKEDDQAAENEDAGDVLEGFEDFFIYLEAMELEVDTDAAKLQDAAVTESVGAEKGVLIPIEGIEAQFYLFNTEDNEMYDEAAEKGTITIDVGGEEFPIPYFVHDGIGFANPDDHYKGKEIVGYLEQF